MALLTEERRVTGIFPVLSVYENTVIANLRRYQNWAFLLNERRGIQDARMNVEQLRTKTPSVHTQIRNLSGGNQQKVLLARWLLTEPEILLLDEPTRGIDVGAKFEIYSIITQLAKQGKSIIMISSEMPELLGMSDRIMVMSEGRLTGILAGQEASEEEIMRLAAQQRSADSGGKSMNTQTIGKVKDYLAQRAIFVVLILLVIGIAVADPNFLAFSTLRDILQQSSTRLIIALGAAFILITGGVDLSAGRVVGLTAVVSASMLQTDVYANRFFPDLPQVSVVSPILIGIAAGLIVGFINGFIVAKLHVPPFIATLGTMVGIYGVNSIYFDMEPNQSQPIGGLRPDFTVWGSGYIDFGVGILSLTSSLSPSSLHLSAGSFSTRPVSAKICMRSAATCKRHMYRGSM